MPDALLSRDALDGDDVADMDNLDLVMNNNLGGEQPVSLTHLRAVRACCDSAGRRFRS
jgi:hypothetical protein